MIISLAVKLPRSTQVKLSKIEPKQINTTQNHGHYSWDILYIVFNQQFTLKFHFS